MMFLANQNRFDFQQYGKDSIIKESTIHVAPLGLWQTRQYFTVSKTKLELQDLAIDLDDLTVLEDTSIFRLSPTRILPALWEDDLLGGIRIGVNL